MKTLTQERLKELFNYDPETGIFTRIISTGNVFSGDVAGTVSKKDGYERICINYKRHLSHRLAFLYVDGYFPEHDVDHINGVRTDNSWNNLRHASRSCNNQNCKVSKNNTSGFHGVTYNKKYNKWEAQAMLNRKKTYLGLHDDILEAALTRLTWEINCELWTCNKRGNLIKSIKWYWPEFNIKSIM